MIAASKAISHTVLARKWKNGFMTRPYMKKRGRVSADSECRAGLRKLQSSDTIRK